MEYVIVGDTERHEDCLIYACGSNREHAEEVLQRILSAPDENDKIVTKGHKNIRVKETSGNNWWNDAFLCD